MTEKEHTDDELSLGKRIKQARDEKGWTQRQLAAAVHVVEVTVSRWENDRSEPSSLATTRLIAQALDKPVGAFVDEAPIPKDKVDLILEAIQDQTDADQKYHERFDERLQVLEAALRVKRSPAQSSRSRGGKGRTTAPETGVCPPNGVKEGVDD